MANPLDPPTVLGRPWTIDDLYALPDNGYRYEIFDGSLLTTPPPAIPHLATVYYLRRLLERQSPESLAIVEGAGVYPNDTNYYIPDLVVVPALVLKGKGPGVDPSEVLLAIEVVSPSNPGNDHVLKRHAYAVAGIREFWIVDERDQTLRVLMPGEHGGYAEHAVIRPGETWRSDEPFPLEVDPGELF
jgi:Uma2 family endonuclease